MPVSQTFRSNRLSRQHFYDLEKAYQECGWKELKEKSRKRPCLKNLGAPEV
jgi:hypothetical protein